MKITPFSSNEEILREFGTRMRAERVAAALTQKDLAEKSGLSIRTISNIESGRDAAFSTVIEYLRALGKVREFDHLLPEETIRPSVMRETLKKPQRVSRVRKAKKSARKNGGWKWGDEE